MATPIPDLPTPTDPPCVFVCQGKDCLDSGDQAKLCRRLADEGFRIEQVKCLGVCSGPVLVTPLDGKLRVLHKIRGRKKLDRVAANVTAGTRDGLGSLEAKKSKAKMAIKLVEKRLARLAQATR
jgi:hypothetical protein